jgi:hypothetical protein
MARTVTRSRSLKECNTFHTLTQALPFEILVQILDYATKGSRDLLRPCQSLSRIAFVSWPFLTAYEGLESEYDFKTRRLPLPHPPSNNLVVSNESSRALAARVPRTSAGVLCNPAMVQAICDGWAVDDSIAVEVASQIVRDRSQLPELFSALHEQVDMLEWDEDYEAYRQLRLAQPPRWQPKIGEALRFTDLRAMASYFESGPGSVTWGTGARLDRVTFVSVVYRDSAYFHLLEGSGVAYAYEAFEALYAARHLLRLTRLQVQCSSGWGEITTESPGMWSLLKWRNLDDIFLCGWQWRLVDVSTATRRRLMSDVAVPWRPLGLEHSDLRAWPQVQQLSLEQQWAWHEKRYMQSQDRKTIEARRQAQRRAHDRNHGVSHTARIRRAGQRRLQGRREEMQERVRSRRQRRQSGRFWAYVQEN